jgi:hypothetical protein
MRNCMAQSKNLWLVYPYCAMDWQNSVMNKLWYLQAPQKPYFAIELLSYHLTAGAFAFFYVNLLSFYFIV